MLFSCLVALMGLINVIAGLKATADTTIEDINTYGDSNGDIDAKFTIFTMLTTVFILVIATFGCGAAHLKHTCCTIFFQILTIIGIVYLSLLGASMIKIKKMGDEFCMITNDPELRAEVSDL